MSDRSNDESETADNSADSTTVDHAVPVADPSETTDSDTPPGARVAGGTDYKEYEDELAVYEWVGMLAAGLGFFLTPLFTALPALYCVQKIRHWKPLTALLIVAVVLSTVVFWMAVVIFIFPRP